MEAGAVQKNQAGRLEPAKVGDIRRGQRRVVCQRRGRDHAVDKCPAPAPGFVEQACRETGVGLPEGSAVCDARLIRSLLYQVEPLDPIVLAGVAAMIFCLTLLVSLRPALEATRLDLTRALREE